MKEGRTVVVQVRFTHEEKKQMDVAAVAVDQSLSDYVRGCIFGDAVTAPLGGERPKCAVHDAMREPVVPAESPPMKVREIARQPMPAYSALRDKWQCKNEACAQVNFGGTKCARCNTRRPKR